ncbi:MAG: phosphatidylserine decarboxylase, partial [Lachnospiraceae bacterium]|nr:phosphatidylserine decarboxylase [Lachnospiraceae bacterium]
TEYKIENVDGNRTEFPKEDGKKDRAKNREKDREKDREILISPCDAKASVYPIDHGRRFRIKHTEYTLEQLLKSKKLASRYEGGTAVILRLTVDDYHRYCYAADGLKSEQTFIKGVLHTVNPAANDVYPIYKMNSREYCLLKTRHFGTILTMEVGALIVGKIQNEHGRCQVKKGQEKGHFEFGGSTIILLLQKDRVEIDHDLILNTESGYETIVKMGERIGKSC